MKPQRRQRAFLSYAEMVYIYGGHVIKL